MSPQRSMQNIRFLLLLLVPRRSLGTGCPAGSACRLRREAEPRGQWVPRRSLGTRGKSLHAPSAGINPAARRGCSRTLQAVQKGNRESGAPPLFSRGATPHQANEIRRLRTRRPDAKDKLRNWHSIRSGLSVCKGELEIGNNGLSQQRFRVV